MSPKILYCDTEFNGWQEKRENLLDYAGRPLECLAKYGADFLGLGSWLELEHEIDFNKYDLIWIYLGHRYLPVPSWYSFPSIIRTKAPNAKIIFTVDYEGHWYNRRFDLRFKLSWEKADMMHVITNWGNEYFRKNLNIPIHYAHLGRPHAGGILNTLRPIPISKRARICFVRHTNLPQIMTQLQVIRKCGMEALGIDSVPKPFSYGNYIPYMADAFRVRGKFYPRLPFNQYLDVMSHAYVGLDNHVGPSRFAYEMDYLSIPVVHTELSEYANILFPNLTCPHDNIESMVTNIKILRANRKLYDMYIKQARYIGDTYFGLDECQKRMDDFIKMVMELKSK